MITMMAIIIADDDGGDDDDNDDNARSPYMLDHYTSLVWFIHWIRPPKYTIDPPI